MLCIPPPHTHTHTHRANQTFETMKKEATSEVAVAKANIKKMTVQIASLQQALQQKAWELALFIILVRYYSSASLPLCFRSWKNRN